MISVIVCSALPPTWKLHEEHVKDTISTTRYILPDNYEEQFEYIRLDNHKGQFKSLCAAYNEGVKRARGDILVFMHEDTNFMETGWGKSLINIFKDESIGAVGVCGTKKLLADNPDWAAAGNPYVQGQLIFPHQRYVDAGIAEPAETPLVLIEYSPKINERTNVLALDGVFIAIRRNLFDMAQGFDHIRWDDKTFDNYHFYDLDICMQILQKHRGRIVVTFDFTIIHYGKPIDQKDMKVHERYGKRFLKKWKKRLPLETS